MPETGSGRGRKASAVDICGMHVSVSYREKTSRLKATRCFSWRQPKGLAKQGAVYRDSFLRFSKRA